MYKKVLLSFIILCCLLALVLVFALEGKDPNPGQQIEGSVLA
jgi:hypothetical protein